MDSPSCPSCGAVIAQRDSLGGMSIPGVTNVNADLQAPSLTGSLVRSAARMNALDAVGSSAGTAVGLAAAAGYLAKDGLAALVSEPIDPEKVGRPSEAALAMVRRLDEQPAEAEAAVELPQVEPAEQFEPAPIEPAQAVLEAARPVPVETQAQAPDATTEPKTIRWDVSPPTNQ